MTSPIHPDTVLPPEPVVDQETLEEVMNITSQGPAPRWETRDQRYEEFLNRDDFKNILGMLAREVFRSRVAQKK